MQEDISVYEHTGTVFEAINRKQFEALPTPNPPQGLVEKFDTMVDPMDDRIKRNTLEMQMLTKCRDLLLPKLISGDIRLCDAESMVGAVA